MIWSGFVAAGSVDGSGNFTESTATGYTRMAFQFASPNKGIIQGLGASITFTASSPVASYNAYAFYTALSGGTQILLYPLTVPVVFGLNSSHRLNPYTLVVDIIDSTVSGITVETGPIEAVVGVSSQQITNTDGTPLFNIFGGDGSGMSVAIGVGAGAADPVTDHGMVAIGYQALTVNAVSSGISENTAVGWGSQRSSTTGSFNTTLGLNTMGLSVSGTANAIVGVDCMRNSEGSNNVAMGVHCLMDGTHTQNVALGFNAITAQGATGSVTSQNVAVGYQAMASSSISTATGNVVVGSNAGGAITSATNSVFVGLNSGLLTTSGANNTGLGASVLTHNTTGFNNTAVGTGTLVNETTGNNNVAVGANAGNKITTGFSNVVIGPNVASTTLTTGQGNIYIGNGSAIDAAAAGENDTFRLGGNATNLVRATGINNAAPAFFLDWLPSSTSYASDSAAATGGVAVGQLYRNGSAVQCRIT